MPKYKRGLWDGYVSLWKGNAFPTGLLYSVRKLLSERKRIVDIDWGDYQSPFKLDYSQIVHQDMLAGIELRDYQLSAINKLLKAKRGIAKMATNAGKTEVFAGIIKALGLPKTIIMVHRKDLMYQTAIRLEKRLGCPIGMFGDSLRQWRDITVCMVKTFQSHMDEVPYEDVKLLVIDECHNTSASNYLDVVMEIPALYRYGFSGTPLKQDALDDMKLMGATGRVLVEISNKDLIEAGYSATPIVTMYEIDDTVMRPNDKASYDDAMTSFIIDCSHRNQMVADIAVAKSSSGSTVLVFVNRIAHGKLLYDMLVDKAPVVCFVSGDDSTSTRLKAIEQMRGGTPGIFIVTNIFDEGVDVPGVDVLILAAGGESPRQLLQRVGRGLRQKAENNVLTVVDFIDYNNKHLLGHSSKRVDTYVQEGFSVDYVAAGTSLQHST